MALSLTASYHFIRFSIIPPRTQNWLTTEFSLKILYITQEEDEEKSREKNTKHCENKVFKTIIHKNEERVIASRMFWISGFWWSCAVFAFSLHRRCAAFGHIVLLLLNCKSCKTTLTFLLSTQIPWSIFRNSAAQIEWMSKAWKFIKNNTPSFGCGVSTYLITVPSWY